MVWSLMIGEASEVTIPTVVQRYSKYAIHGVAEVYGISKVFHMEVISLKFPAWKTYH